jgi:phosphonoacetate hydrolase
VPLPDRVFSAVSTGGEPGDLRRAVEVLLAPDLAAVVELIAWRSAPGEITVATSVGSCVLTADGHRRLEGEDPLARQDPLALTGVVLRAERGGNHFPHAAVRLRSAFADPDRAPDIAVVHTDAHHWPERGGHLGEHGSLGVLQSRAPLVLAGPGVAAQGLVARAARTVDVTPTLLALAGLPVPGGLDGAALATSSAARVVGLLWDGANAGAVYAGARDGMLPHVARLIEAGTAYVGGAIAEFPSVTLVNHTSALTGVGPGRHGIVHNAYYDRAVGRSIVANDSTTWHAACDLLRPGVRTLWEMAGDISTACVNEPIDRGAQYSTFALVRAAGTADGARSLGAALPSPTDDPNATAAFVASHHDYSWATQVDALGLTQMLTLFGLPEPPRLTWWNVTLTDSAHHAGGAHSPIATAGLVDADRRLGALLELLDERGLFESTAFLLTADHGMVAADPAVTGDWDEALASAGVSVRDEAYGFLYLD